MTSEKTIFGDRFQGNENLQPTQAQIDAFLRSARDEKKRETHGSDLVKYQQLVKEAGTFEKSLRTEIKPRDPREHLFFGVLKQTHFFNPALLAAVELFRYHYNALLVHDFYHSMLFIISSEKEMARLDKKKINDALRIARLQEMLGERVKTLPKLKKPWLDMVGELLGITHYVRDNLFKMMNLCEVSLAILNGFEIEAKKEKQMIEEIKDHVKDQLKSALRQGRPVTQQDLDRAKKEVDAITKDLRSIIRTDIEAMASSFKAVLDHVGKIAWQIDVLLSKSGAAANKSIEETVQFFSGIERAITSLVAEHRFAVQPTLQSIKPSHEVIIQEKRIEMLNHLLKFLMTDRRARTDRRGLQERRKRQDPSYRGPERRKNQDRRAVKIRRRTR